MPAEPLFETYTERNPRTVKAVQLTSRNVEPIIAWLKEAGMEVHRVSWAEITLLVPDIHGDERVVARGEWLVPKGKGFEVFADKVFREHWQTEERS